MKCLVCHPQEARSPRARPSLTSRMSWVCLPDFELPMIDIEGRAADVTKQNIVVADDQLAIVEAHRETPVAAAARLVEHDRTAPSPGAELWLRVRRE